MSVVTIACFHTFPDMPYLVWYLLLYSGIYLAFNITWFVVYLFLAVFVFLILHGVCIIGIIGCILVGGLIPLFMYHHLCFYFLLSL